MDVRWWWVRSVSKRLCQQMHPHGCHKTNKMNCGNCGYQQVVQTKCACILRNLWSIGQDALPEQDTQIQKQWKCSVMVCRDRVCAIPRSGRVTEYLKRTVKRLWVKGLWQVWRNIRYDNHTIDCTPLYLWKLWAVKCNEQAERQLRKAKPQYGKLSIVRGKRSVVLEHGYRGT